MKLVLTAGDFDLSFFFKLRFSGAVSSGAESSTSKSLSGELGEAWLWDGDNVIENDLLLASGLLGEDSDPVSGSVSAESRALLFPTVEKKQNCHEQILFIARTTALVLRRQLKQNFPQIIIYECRPRKFPRFAELLDVKIIYNSLEPYSGLNII